MSAAGTSIVPDYSPCQSDHGESRFTPRPSQRFWRGNSRVQHGELLNQTFSDFISGK